ncbi:MAG: beta-lactamase family protein, partial [Actinomycetota bacterium]|nr:beta-lactamase family protein [Actinomycetota bacterium]
MTMRRGLLLSFALVITLAGCAPTPDRTETSDSVEASAPRVASASPGEQAPTFPTAAFVDISEDPVPKSVAAEFQAILNDVAGRAGMAATVMSPDGAWSGGTGKADRVRDVRVDDQFAIGSITKSVIAAQVMQLVEAGALALDDPVSDHVPAGLDFNTNKATIRDLLSMRSGIPDYVDELW